MDVRCILCLLAAKLSDPTMSTKKSVLKRRWLPVEPTVRHDTS